jgi:hypothetical protein
VSVGLARLMVRDNDNVSACSNISTRGLLCQWGLSPLTQQPPGRHVITHGHIIIITNHQSSQVH